MEILPSVTVELFDYWLRNSFFWEYGDVAGRATSDFYPTDDSDDIKGAQAMKIEVATFSNGELLTETQVLVTRRKYYARYLVRKAQGKTFRDFGEILIEQLEVDRLRVHCYEAEGSGFLAKFGGWLNRVYKGDEPAEAAKQKQIRQSGRPSLEANQWARREHESGRSLDDLLPEYIAKREELGETLADPRESLRQALKAPKAKKPRNAKK